MFEIFKGGLVFSLFFVFLGYGGEADYENALLEQQRYCVRLNAEIHTDYLRLAKICDGI